MTRQFETSRLGRAHLWMTDTTLDATFSLPLDEASAFCLFDEYAQKGGRSFQIGLANTHPCPTLERQATLLAAWMRERRVPREKVVLGYRLTPHAPAAGGSVTFLNQLRTQVERTCGMLHTDYVDLLVCRWQLAEFPIRDLAEAIDLLTRAGLIRHAVAEDWPLWRVADLCVRASLARSARCEAVQLTTNAQALVAAELIEALHLCRTYRLGLLLRPLGEDRSNDDPANGSVRTWLDSLKPDLTSIVRPPEYTRQWLHQVPREHDLRPQVSAVGPAAWLP